MGIEAIGSIGSGIANVASAVGKGASSVGRIGAEGPIGKLSDFGPRLEGPLTPIINEGSVGLIDLKNTMPLQLGQINPVSELRFDSPVPKRNILIGEGVAVEPRIIREATYWFTDVEPKVVKPAEVIMPQVEPMVAPIAVPNGLEYPKPQVAVSPAWEVQSALQSKTESRISAGPAQTVSVQSTTESQGKKEEVLDEKVVKENPKEVLQEEEIADKKAYLEDEEASGQRRHEVREAIVEAKVEADRLGLKKITGWLVAKFLPAEHEGVRSQIIKEQGPDGSYQEIVEELAEAGEFESETAAQERVDQLVAEKKPAKYGKNGTPLAFRHVARIFKYRIFEPVQANVEVIKRVVKRKVVIHQQNALFVSVGEKKETNLEELSPDLAEVFQKAA